MLGLERQTMNRRRLLAHASVVLILAASCAPGEQTASEQSNPTSEMRQHLSQLNVALTPQLTESEIDALVSARSALLKIGANQNMRSLLFRLVQPQISKRFDISWEDAASMISKGEIYEVHQRHQGPIILESFSGVSYAAANPGGDEAWHLVNEVDPKHKFIHLTVE